VGLELVDDQPMEDRALTQAPQLRALGATLGTEVLGIDLSKPPEADTFAGIQAPLPSIRCWSFGIRTWVAPELAAFGRRFGAPPAPRADQVSPRRLSGSFLG